jgi:membrane-anchored glycerophosphoryl diester phosphodiesterase (GDPDase)
LILPAMVIDNLNLKDGMQRVLNITRQNLLLIGISTVGVRWVTGLIGFVLGFGGFVIAFAVGGGAAYLADGFNALSIIGIVIGVFIFFTFVVIASVVNSYTSVAYHTCLYIWARDVEKAQAAGQSFQIPAPAPLAAVLG